MERLILAYDSDCRSCTELSKRIGFASHGKLETLPLTHPDVHRWREEESLLERWEPTIFKISTGGELIGGRTGPPMLPWLAKTLTFAEQSAVLREIGQMQLEGRKTSRITQTLGRRGFIKMSAGVAVVTNLLFMGGSRALAVGGDSGLTSGSTIELTEAQKQLLLAKFLGSDDLDKVLRSPSSEGRLTHSQLGSKVVLSTGPESFGNADRGSVNVLVAASETAELALARIPDGRLISWRNNLRPINGTRTEVILWEFDDQAEQLRPLEVSHNGLLDGSLESGMSHGSLNPSSDCGACYNPPYGYRSVRCTYDVSCLGSGCRTFLRSVQARHTTIHLHSVCAT